MDKFEYKSAEFFTQYFESHPDFKVLEQFKLSTDKEEKNTFVGIVEILNTIHPLELRVEIPESFPHHKLTFRTKSLSGYPHLIHTGKIEYGDWFCLNTPFAETAEEQLEQEISRLKYWIKMNMREGLPALIKDKKLREALFNISVPEWMNPDAVKEVESKAVLTFIGNFAEKIDNIKETVGKFNCLKTPDKRFYAFKDNQSFTNWKLPYVIVDGSGIEDLKILNDFFSLKEYYNWSEEICNHLLPGYNVGKPMNVWHSLGKGILGHDGLNLNEEDALKQMESLREELAKEESYLNPADLQYQLDTHRNRVYRRILVSPAHKNLILNELDVIERSIKKDQGIKIKPHRHSIPEEEWTEADWEEDAREDYLIETQQYLFDYFVVGFNFGQYILWMIFYTNHAAIRREQNRYNIEIGSVIIDKYTSLGLNRSIAQTLDESMFFGRGVLCDTIRQKKVALIGLGAIGSMVGEALAHSGIKKIGLWDSETVEPGNICRSTYSLHDLGESKVQSVAKRLRNINPFIETDDIKASGKWIEFRGDPNDLRYMDGSFYDNINYISQEEAVNKIKDYDLIIDCTGRNEILHFISYALPDKDIISLAITNKAKELLCISNRNGNPFELRKAYLSSIAQDTKDYYVEGSGCYEPTFKATYFDICSLVNLCIKELNSNMEEGQLINSTIFRYNHRGIVADRMHTYKLSGTDIILNIPNEVLLDGDDLPESEGEYLGFIFGSYSKDGKEIMVTHIVEPDNAERLLEKAFSKSKGIIDYLGDVAYSGEERGSVNKASLEDIAAKAMDEDINTNNPLLAIRNPEGDFTFFLYINGGLIPFSEMD